MKLNFKKYKLINMILLLFVSVIISIINSNIVSGQTLINETKNVIIKLEKYPFIENDDNKIWVYSDNNKEKVQYRILYNNKNSKNDDWIVVKDINFNNEWSNYVNANEPYIFDLSYLKLKAGDYRICVQVRNINNKNKSGIESSINSIESSIRLIQSSNEYNFKVLSTLQKENLLDSISNSELSRQKQNFSERVNLLLKSLTFSTEGGNLNKTDINLYLDKQEYKQNETIIIKSSNEINSTDLYKLKLYNIETQILEKDLYEYDGIVKYDLNCVKPGRYIATLYYKNIEYKNKYDGFKMFIIKVVNVAAP